MAAYSESPPTVSLEEVNDDVFPREKSLPYNVNPGLGGAAALLLHTHQLQSTAKTQLSLLQSGFNSNTFNTKLIATSGLGICSSKENGQYKSSISSDLQTDQDGNLITKVTEGKHKLTIFSNQAVLTRGGRFPQRDSSHDGTLVTSVRELGFGDMADAVEETFSFLIGCSTSRSDENTPVACCYLVEIRKGKEGWKLDAQPAGKIGMNEMKNNWKFSINQESVVEITGPPESHFVFFCNRIYRDDVVDDSTCGKVFFEHMYNGEHSVTLLPKIRTHYGRAMFLLCSGSNPETNAVTAALYFVAPMANKVGVYYIAESTDEPPSRASPALWLVSKKIGKLVVKTKPGLTGPCRYAFISSAPEDIVELDKRCIQNNCIAIEAETPFQGRLSVDDGCLRVRIDRRIEVKVESDDDDVVVGESDLRNESGWFVYEKDVSNELKARKGVNVFKASVVLTTKERRHVTVELAGSPCRVITQLPDVYFAVNFGGPTYVDENGVVFTDGRSTIASVNSDSNSYYYGTHLDPLRNYPQVIANTCDGSLYSTFIGNRLNKADGLDFKIPVGDGKCLLSLYTVSSGLDGVTVLLNGEDVSLQIHEQLRNQNDSISQCTAKKASILVPASGKSLDISLKRADGFQLSALLVQAEDINGTCALKPELTATEKQELGDDLAPLDRHISGYDLANLSWSGNILNMNKKSEHEQDFDHWTSQLGGDGVEKKFTLTSDSGLQTYCTALGNFFEEKSLDQSPTVQFTVSVRSPGSLGATYAITTSLEKPDGSVVKEEMIDGTLSRSDCWSRVKVTIEKYGTCVRNVKITIKVTGKGFELSAPSLRIKSRRPHATGLKDAFCDVKIVKDTKMLAGLIRNVVQKYGIAPLDDRTESQSSLSLTPTDKNPTPSPKNYDDARTSDGDDPKSKPSIQTDTKHGPSSRTQPRKKREIRVFVSSTFLDFAAEREILIKKVFSEIKKMCLDRGVFFTCVDLRWGITSDQSNDGQTISICLREIDRCRPYFICLLGDRFGWSQREHEVDELLNKSYDYAIENFSNLKWIDEYRYNSSVTQLEVFHSALRHPENASDRTFFYLRKPKTKEDLLKEERHEPEWKIDEQKKFRQTVQESGLPIRHYKSADEGTDLIRKDLERCINEEFPPESKLTHLQREREAHLSFAEVRRRVYIGRAEYFTRINDYFAGDPNLPLVILGESGSGKSALVANWCGRIEEQHPNDFLFMHFIGSSADSASHLRLLRRLFEELKQHFDLELGIPTSDKSLAQDLPKWLSIAGSYGQRVLIVLDALNQLDSGAGGQGDELELKWLPQELPPNVQMLVSTLPGKALDAVKSFKWPVFHVHPLDQAEKGEIIRCYMEIYAKSLNAEQTDLIVSAKQTSNALYLRALLDEIRVYGSFYDLTASVKTYLEAEDPGQLFVKVLERLESDFERGEHGRPNLVRDTTCAIWCSSRGMSEQELVSFLQIPSRIWSPFYLSLEENLVNRNGIVNFFHDHLRQAVERKYVSTQADKRRGYLILAEFFENQDINERYVEELSSLLMELSDLPRLKAVVMIPRAFQLLMKTSEGQARLIQAWRMLGGFEQAGQAYLEFVNHSNAFKEVEEKESLLACLTDFFMELGILKIARQLNVRLLKTLEEIHARHNVCRVTHHVRYESERKTRHHDVIENLLELGTVCQKLADFSAAADYFEDALSRLTHPDSAEQRIQMIKALTGLGQVYGATSQPLEAHRFFMKALEICREVLPVNHHYVATLNGLIGELCYIQGKAAEALRYHAFDIIETQRTSGLGKPRMAAILNNIGLALMELDPTTEDALPFFVQALAILIDSYGLIHVDVASVRTNLAAYFFNAKLYKYSLFQYKRAFEIFKIYMGSLHPKAQESRKGQRELRPFTLVD